MPNKKLTHDFLMQCLEKAKEIQDRTGALGIRECGEAWGYPSTSATAYVMKKMVTAGMLLEYQAGTYTRRRVNPDYTVEV